MEGNLISFKLLINLHGDLITEVSMLPKDKISKVFKKDDAPLIHKAISEAEIKLKGLHKYLEDEISAFNNSKL
jgi:hypothetical protein